MSNRDKMIAAKWCDLLKIMVESQYCLGGASPEEIKAATVDFLMNAAERIYSQIPQSTLVPPLR